MEFSIKQLGGIVIAIVAILLTVGIVRGVVDKTSQKIDSEMGTLGSISEQYADTTE